MLTIVDRGERGVVGEERGEGFTVLVYSSISLLDVTQPVY